MIARLALDGVRKAVGAIWDSAHSAQIIPALLDGGGTGLELHRPVSLFQRRTFDNDNGMLILYTEGAGGHC